MNKNLIFLFLCCLGLSKAGAQRLRIGDTLPSLKLVQVINSEKPEYDLNVSKGKFYILDFWQTSCKGCLASFPKLDSLQKQFADFVQIIAVNNETKDSTLRFFTKRKKIRLPHEVPFVTGDSILSTFFPRNYSPWLVWIDNDKVVRYITSGSGITETNIREFLAGRKPVFEEVEFNGSGLIRE